jgi:Rrf2 family protein
MGTGKRHALRSPRVVAAGRGARGAAVGGPRPTMPDVKVSTRGDYASRALLSLALHAETAGPTSVRDIAERTGLPQPYLEQILLALKGAGLVRSKRGVGGGYVLARAPEEISLSDIVSAVDGPIVAGDFGEPHTDGACDHEGQCVLLAVWADVGEHMRRYLEAATLADIVRMARGEATWPGETTSGPAVTPTWAGTSGR